MNEQEWIEKLKKEGFKDINVCPNGPNTDFGEHTHHKHTVHVILKGELIILDKGKVTTMKQWDRFEFPAGTKHSTKTGSTGCTFIVGVKEKIK